MEVMLLVLFIVLRELAPCSLSKLEQLEPSTTTWMHMKSTCRALDSKARVYAVYCNAPCDHEDAL